MCSKRSTRRFYEIIVLMTGKFKNAQSVCRMIFPVVRNGKTEMRHSGGKKMSVFCKIYIFIFDGCEMYVRRDAGEYTGSTDLHM